MVKRPPPPPGLRHSSPLPPGGKQYAPSLGTPPPIDTWDPTPIPSLLCVLSTRDLLQLGGELARTSRAVQEAGQGLSVGLQLAESRAEAALEKQALLQAQLEEQLRDKVLQEEGLAQLQMQSNLDKADFNARWVPGRYHVRQGTGLSSASLPRCSVGRVRN